MISKTTEGFRKRFADLPSDVQAQAKRMYRLWRRDPRHNSLQFKPIHPRLPIYSVRVGSHYRAVGRRSDEGMIWFWVGSHAGYDHLLSQL